MLKKDTNTLTIAAFAVFVSGVLHLALIPAGVNDPPALFWVGIAIVYSIFAVTMTASKRWLLYIVYLVMCVGSIVAYLSAPQTMVFSIIALADLVAAICLFGHLWATPNSA